MQLYTKLNIPPSAKKISFHHAILSVGSCFAVHMGHRLLEVKFNAATNPMGIVYNPHSIYDQVKFALTPDSFPIEKYLIQDQSLWHSLLHHGQFSNEDKPSLLKEVNGSAVQMSHSIKNAQWMMITLGTAIIHTYKKTNIIAANNHRLPGQEFTSRRLKVNEVAEILVELSSIVKKVNPDIQFIWTVSPVRHIKSGLAESSKSKAALLLGIDQMCTQYEHHQYFPAFELMMDELRDYRFYKPDMIHPTDQSVNHIWERFLETYLDANERALYDDIEKIVKSKNHRPIRPDSAKAKQFKQKQFALVQKLAKTNPHLDLTKELEHFSEK